MIVHVAAFLSKMGESECEWDSGTTTANWVSLDRVQKEEFWKKISLKFAYVGKKL